MIKKIFNRYKNMPIPAKSSIWFVICTIIQKLIAFITVPIFTRIMTASDYGIYNTYISWFSIIVIICTLNMHNCIYMNSLTKMKSDKEKNDVATSLLSLSATITIILFIIYLLFSNIFNKIIGLPTISIIFMFFHILFVEAINFWTVKQRFEYNYVKLVVVTVLITLLHSILGIIFVLIFNNNQAVARIISYVLIYFIFGLFIYISFLKKSKKLFSISFWKKAIKVQLPLLPHELSIVLLYSSDRIMINNILGSMEAGIYSVAYSVGHIINSIKISIVHAINPWLYDKIKNKKFLDIKQKTYYILLFIFLIDIFFIAFAPELVKILAPSEYYHAIYVIPPVATSAFFTFLYSIFSSVSFYYEKSKSIMIVSMSCAILNIILNLIFINLFGYIAASYTTLISYITFAFLHYIIMKKVCKKHLNNAILFDMPKIVILSIIILLVCTLLTFLYKYIYIRYILIIGIIIFIYFKRDRIIYDLKNVISFKNKKSR